MVESANVSISYLFIRLIKDKIMSVCVRSVQSRKLKAKYRWVFSGWFLLRVTEGG